MLAVKNLENLIKIENELKAQYEDKLSNQAAEIASGQETIKELEATIAKQQESLLELSNSAADKKRIEQTNRELSNRTNKQQEEIDEQKKRIKTLQKELAEVRAEVKKLNQLDAEKLKKNLVANKKKLAEKTASNDLLQKSINKTKSENNELVREVAELKAKLAELQPEEEAAEESAA
ncbi:hypothetical protein NO559_16755 [Dasania sp. GY-MA-18]|uniref:Uncharacterized protein n=1 Tax=Dasania phycosphaerae TaxID=2950436 RepID=A0A9J6RSN7_9GAMM|nr:MULTISPECIES: hypothetical protein [Dasania]MCR8924426.1 hypothetical protein [Dasania sp. GY-MA-18]MCZ0867101.1 hypothetical protein [Dasania phycosphaerae]MCZ0870553.1 hypothetical protein [Dasania phycosphaerae]